MNKVDSYNNRNNTTGDINRSDRGHYNDNFIAH